MLTQSNSLMINVAWKLVICLPDTHYESKSRAVCEMVKRKFTQEHMNSKTDDPNLLLCQSFPFGPTSSFVNNPKMYSFCVRCVTNQVLDEEIAVSEKKRKEKLSGTSALLFIHIAKDDAREGDEFSLEEDEDDPQTRIDSLLRKDSESTLT